MYYAALHELNLMRIRAVNWFKEQNGGVTVIEIIKSGRVRWQHRRWSLKYSADLGWICVCYGRIIFPPI